MCLASIKLFIVRTIYECHVSNLYNLYNHNCWLDILLCLQPFCKQQHLFVRSVQRKPSNHDCSLTQRLFTQGSLNSYCSAFVLSCLLWSNINNLMNVLEAERWCSRFLENSIATSLLFVSTVLHVFLMLVVVGLLGTCSMYLLKYICVVC